jgi:hypothetical protein
VRETRLELSKSVAGNVQEFKDFRGFSVQAPFSAAGLESPIDWR